MMMMKRRRRRRMVVMRIYKVPTAEDVSFSQSE